MPLLGVPSHATCPVVLQLSKWLTVLEHETDHPRVSLSLALHLVRSKWRESPCHPAHHGAHPSRPHSLPCMAAGLKDTARALHVDMLLCRARAAQLLGNEETALEALKEASRSCEPSDIRAAVLGGKLHMQVGAVTL
jgi:hypothetical protein